MKVLVDTNVLLRLVHLGHTHQLIAAAAIQQIRQKRHEPCAVPQVYYEYWAVATRPEDANGLGFTVTDAQSQLTHLKDLIPPHRDERGISERWEELVVRHSVRGKSTHDARLVAAMLRHNITYLLTFDHSDFARYTEIKALAPDAVVAGTVSIG